MALFYVHLKMAWRAKMRGHQESPSALFYVIDVEARIRSDHPLRPVKQAVDRILTQMRDRFEAAYSAVGRPSIPPERLLKALLLMALYSVRSERQLVERIDTDLLFRWFLGMSPEEVVFDATSFTHNRPRLEEHGLTKAFFDAVLTQALTANLCSEHFSVDGTLIESYASVKSFRPKTAAAESSPKDKDPKDGAGTNDSNSFKPRNAEVDFHGEKRTNETHESRTDPEARLYRKGAGQGAKLAHMAHVLSENRNGLIIGITASEANGTAERTAALDLIDEAQERHKVKPKTVGTDKGYDSGEFYQELENRKIEPHGAMTSTPPCDPDKARPANRAKVEARHRMRERLPSDGYRLSQKCRKKVEECFGWLKTIAGLGRNRVIGRWKLQQLLEIGAAAYNLLRLRKLQPAA
jgi:transposase